MRRIQRKFNQLETFKVFFHILMINDIYLMMELKLDHMETDIN